MQPTQTAKYIVIFLSVTFVIPYALGREGIAAFSMSVDEFGKLSPQDQKSILGNAFDYRLRFARNIYVVSHCRASVHEFLDGRPGSKVTDLYGRNYREWRLNDSYRVDTERGGIDVSNISEWSSFQFDAPTGLARHKIRLKDQDREFARIDAKRDIALGENRYDYWLDGKHDHMGEYLIRYLVTYKDQYLIETPIEDGKIRVIVPWKPVHSEKILGKREFILDPEKGFLPIRGKARWEENNRSRREEFDVEVSRLISDFWMPIKIKELISTGRAPDKVTVWDTTVKSIEAGRVVAKDLEVTFVKGTLVVDAIKDISYTVGSGDKPINVQPLADVVPEQARPPEGRNWLRFAIIAIVIISLSVLVVWRNRRRGMRIEKAS